MDNAPLRILAWAGSFLCCVYFAWAYVDLNDSTKTLSALYVMMAIDLPSSTRVLLANHRFLCAALFAGAGLFVVGKEFLVRNKKISLATSLLTGLAVFVAARWIESVLASPLMDFGEKLGK